jgi:hypothetical protein
MFALICAYLCIPERFRFIARLFAVVVVLVVVALVLTLFARILLTLPQHPTAPVRPKSDQVLPSHVVRRHPGLNVTMRRVHAD